MKIALSLLLLLLTSPIMAAADSKADDVAHIKSAISQDWLARTGDFGSVVVASPSYAMPFDQGCVIHELAFLSNNGHASLGQMVATDRYYVFTQGDECAAANPTQFFGIEPGNDTTALLDFARTLKGGPRSGKDTISKADYARIAPCFAPGAMAATRIVGAHSWRVKAAGRDDRYQVVLHCKAVEETGEIVANGVRDQGQISWALRPWGQIGVDVPAKQDEH